MTESWKRKKKKKKHVKKTIVISSGTLLKLNVLLSRGQKDNFKLRVWYHWIWNWEEMYINGSSTPVNQRSDIHNTTCPQYKQSEDRHLILCGRSGKDCRTRILELRLKGQIGISQQGKLEKSVLGRGNSMCKVRCDF